LIGFFIPFVGTSPAGAKNLLQPTCLRLPWAQVGFVQILPHARPVQNLLENPDKSIVNRRLPC
jgi:hypothetical protein